MTAYLLRAGRLVTLILLSVIGTSALMYFAPGYFTDAREADAAYASTARNELDRLRVEQHSFPALLRSEMRDWSHGDLGRSRQYGTPVASLITERAARSARLLLSGIGIGWTAALLLAIPLSMRQTVKTEVSVAVVTAVVLGLPVGLLATVCLLANTGGPIFVLSVLIAARDFKLLYRKLQEVWRLPFVFHARAQGISLLNILRVHIAPVLAREVLSIAILSFTLALSALVPLEVIFDVPGLGKMAWTAAMNRDLPVLVAVTALLSACVGLAGYLVEPARSREAAQCA